MDKRIKQFGGENRVFLTDEMLNNIPESAKERLSDEALEALDILKEGFQLLSPLQKQVMSLLVSEQDITYKKVAGIVGSTEGAVTLAVFEGKRKLLKYAKENADGSIYIESMLKRINDDKAKTKNGIKPTRKAGKS